MTREEAIRILSNRDAHGIPCGYTSGYQEALELAIEALSDTPTEQNEEDILKFYYVESLDEYWIGQRCGTRYYGKWTGNCFTFGYSRYLPWGEHVVAPDTLWKEHTYPSEPKEIPFNEWLQGFLEKECPTERTGEWIEYTDDYDGSRCGRCSSCGEGTLYAVTYDLNGGRHTMDYCPNCGAKMKGKDRGMTNEQHCKNIERFILESLEFANEKERPNAAILATIDIAIMGIAKATGQGTDWCVHALEQIFQAYKVKGGDDEKGSLC